MFAFTCQTVMSTIFCLITINIYSFSDVPEHIRLEGRYLTQEDAFVYWDIHLLQVMNKLLIIIPIHLFS